MAALNGWRRVAVEVLGFVADACDLIVDRLDPKPRGYVGQPCGENEAGHMVTIRVDGHG